MNCRLLVGTLSCVIVACNITSLLAKAPPASAEQLRSELESAYKNKDANSFVSLICWDGEDSDTKTMASGMTDEEMTKSGTNIFKFTLSPAPTNFQATVTSFGADWEGDNGMRYKYNIPVIGMIHVGSLGKDSKEKQEDLPYGKKGDAFYIAQIVGYQIPGKYLKVDVLNVRGVTYTGYWTYVQSGKEITIPINDHTNESKSGWGDYVKYCYVQRTTTNQVLGFYPNLEYRVRDGIENVVFDSGDITNEVPVIYERKQ